MSSELGSLPTPANEKEMTGKNHRQKTFDVAENPPNVFFNLLVLAPVYNPTLKPNTTICVCSNEAMKIHLDNP